MSEPPQQSPRKWSADIDGVALLGTAFVAMLVVLVNYIAGRRYERFDLTEDRVFTLSERTGNLLTSLDKPVELYVFMARGEPSYDELHELIERYRAKSDRIQAEFVDPDREPTRFKLLAEKYGVRTALQENGKTEAELAVLAVSGEKRWSITRDDLVDVDMDSLDPSGAAPKVNVKTEQALSGAIVQVTSGRATKVCLSEGHGEWSLTDSAERSLAAVKEELKRENVDLEAFPTRGKSEVPKSCDALFVLGPVKAFSDEESALFKRYVDAGGNLLLALDPIVEGDRVLASGLEGFLSTVGIRVDADVVVELDRDRLLSPRQIEAFLANKYGPHEAVQPLAALGAPIVLQLARTLGAEQKAEVVLSASDKAYGEKDLAQLTALDDLKPSEGDVAPVHVAVGVDTRPEKEKLGGRVIAIGDSDWLHPELLQQPQLANVDLLASFTGYLTEREALIAIAPKKLDARSIVLTEEGLIGIFVRVVVLMPLAALVLGVGVWWQRRA